MGAGLPSWQDVVDSAEAKVRARDRHSLIAALAACGPLPTPVPPLPAALASTAAFGRILSLCPCLFAQVDVRGTAKSIVHLCEVTLGTRITSSNVHAAFDVQHPATNSFAFPPRINEVAGGDIMEALCSEVLSNHGLPEMQVGADGWPEWQTKGHLTLNVGKMRDLKLYGDLLIPAAPHNILISVKSMAAKERLVVSGNRLESIGFGFFNQPKEFWTSRRMNLFKRWGFIAIYMPQTTLTALLQEIQLRGRDSHAVNINGKPLYRALDAFGPEMHGLSGRHTVDF